MFLSALLLTGLSLILTPAESGNDKTPPITYPAVWNSERWSQPDQYRVSSTRKINLKAGRISLGGCGDNQLRQIMQHVVGPLQSVSRLRLGDVAQILQQSVQRATGRSHEILMGKGDMALVSSQMKTMCSCKLRIGEYYTAVYETPVQYDINNIEQETIMSNIDFGEPLGGSGYPGQLPFPHSAQGTDANSIVPGQTPSSRLLPATDETFPNEINTPQGGLPAPMPPMTSGKASLSGCGNALLGQISEQTVGPLLRSANRMKLGDIAKILQKSIQQATGKSHEILIGKGEMVVSSQQTNPAAVCRIRIGEYDVTVYETPNQYNILDVELEKFLANVDFGEPLGSSGYPGQWPWPHWIIDDLLHGIFPRKECFSGDLLVETQQGPKRMSELKTGDEVLSIDETIVMFSPIIMFLHRDEEFLAEFNVITTASGDMLKLTNEHLVYVFECDDMSTFRLIRAKDVSTQHCLFVVRTAEHLQTTVKITNVTKTYERGIYAPLTATGDIIVNEVVSSCHSNLAISTLQNSFFTVYRAVHRLLSFMIPEESGKIPIGLVYFTTALEFFIPVKAV